MEGTPFETMNNMYNQVMLSYHYQVFEFEVYSHWYSKY